MNTPTNLTSVKMLETDILAQTLPKKPHSQI